MPLHKNIKIVFSKRIKTPSGKETLALFGRAGKSKNIKIVDTRICNCPKNKNKKCKCPRDPIIREKLKKKLGI